MVSYCIGNIPLCQVLFFGEIPKYLLTRFLICAYNAENGKGILKKKCNLKDKQTFSVTARKETIVATK